MITLSVVVPSARSYRRRLVRQLAAQAQEGDEIIVVRNRRPRAGRWAGIAGRPEDEAAERQDEGLVRPMLSEPGAAAARNAGIRAAGNEWVLFLDDDVDVPSGFLAEVRRQVAASGQPRVVAFRIRHHPSPSVPSAIASLIGLDRGGDDRMAPPRLALHDTWMYGAGAALLAHGDVLATTGGFKESLGAGRRHGGAEDLEFLWHAARHAVVEYRGCVAIGHPGPGSLWDAVVKFIQYGRAIGRLAGWAGTGEGWPAVVGYCTHLAAGTASHRLNGLGWPTRALARAGAAAAVLESLRVYAVSILVRPRESVLCPVCRWPG